MRAIRFRVFVPRAREARRREERERRPGREARILAGAALAAVTVYFLETKPMPGAVATASPARVEFQGDDLLRSVAIASAGSSPLRIRSVAVRGRDAAGFAIVRETCGHGYLPPGDSCAVDLRFTGRGEATGELLVTGNAEEGPLVVGLHAAGAGGPSGTSASSQPSHSTETHAVAPSRLVAPPSLEFGSMDVGANGASRTLIVMARGETPVRIVRIALNPDDDFRVDQDGCSGKTLSGGQSCRIQVAFVPSAGGPRSGRLEIAPAAPVEPLRIALAGAGVARPEVQVAPNPVVFQATVVGRRAQRDLRVTVARKSPSLFAKATLSGPDPHDFLVANDGCRDKRMNAVPSCTIQVRFTPHALGDRAAILTLAAIVGGQGKALAAIDLRGQGVGTSALVLDPPSLTFAAGQVTVAPAPQTIRVRKTGPGALTVESVAALQTSGRSLDAAAILGMGTSSPDFTASGDCAGKTLREGETCTIAVRFAPAGYGDRHGVLAVKPSGSTVAVTARLDGSGPSEPVGWCCVDYVFSEQTATECAKKKGAWHRHEEEETARTQCYPPPG